MDIETVRHFFAWCTVINYAMLLLWFALHMSLNSWLVGISQRFFRIPPEKYDSATYKGMMFYKLAIFLFNLAPYLALRVIS
jgi:hypothetical protein